MIGMLKGTILEITDNTLVVNVHGIGFVITVTAHYARDLRCGQDVSLHTRCVFRDDGMAIYGFAGTEERDAFEKLTSVSGVGPKLAMNILGRLSPAQIAQAVEQENLSVFSSIAKIGSKLASKIILELKGKLSFAPSTASFAQALSALCSLGLTRNEALERLKRLDPELPVEEMVKQALKQA